MLFLGKEYPQATTEQIIIVCKAALQLFPSIGSVVSFCSLLLSARGTFLKSCLFLQEALYDKTKQSGSLFNKIRYNNAKKSRKRRMVDNSNDDADDWTPEEKRDLSDFFQHCVVRTQRQQIEEKLRETVAYRRKMILSSMDEFMEMWEFYFAAPDLVSVRMYVLCQISFQSYNQRSIENA